MGAGRHVDREVRTVETVYAVEDRVAYNVVYYGRTELHDALDTDPVWQIWRVARDGQDVDTVYADNGKYRLKWADRYGYFSPEPAYEPTPTNTTYPSGLTIAGKITIVAITDATWTALPPIPLNNRNAMAIQNDSGVEIKLQYNPLEPGYVGVKMSPSVERMYDITTGIPIYAKAFPGSGAVNITVEELS